MLFASKRTIEFRLLCHGDEQSVQDELKRQKKSFKGGFAGVKPELSTRLRKMILSVDGESDPIKIRNPLANDMPSQIASGAVWACIQALGQKNCTDIGNVISFSSPVDSL